MVWYGNKQCPGAVMDTESGNHRGPETITITDTSKGKFVFFVKQQSERGEMRGSLAIARLFTPDSSVRMFRIGTDGKVSRHSYTWLYTHVRSALLLSATAPCHALSNSCIAEVCRLIGFVADCRSAGTRPWLDCGINKPRHSQQRQRRYHKTTRLPASDAISYVLNICCVGAAESAAVLKLATPTAAHKQANKKRLHRVMQLVQSKSSE